MLPGKGLRDGSFCRAGELWGFGGCVTFKRCFVTFVLVVPVICGSVVVLSQAKPAGAVMFMLLMRYKTGRRKEGKVKSK